jgi:ketosteroid isomerase-like protein
MATTIAEAQALWKKYDSMCQNQEEAIFDFYTDDTLIFEDVPGYKNMVKRGSVYVPVVRSLLRAANKRGEKILDSTFRDIQFVQAGDNVRINATRHSNIKNFDSPFSLLVGKGGDGQIVILEERMEHVLDGPLEHVEITIEVEGDLEE